MTQSAPRTGVLCLQGDYEAHGRVLERLGAAWRDVRHPTDLEGLQGLVLPGGESTTMWHFLRTGGFPAALQAFGGAGGALFGTCAGAILLATRVLEPPGAGLGLLDIDLVRNAYGRQVESRVARATFEDGATDLEAVLIRAPRIVRAGPSVEVRARLGEDPAWVRQGRIQATTFHPELGSDARVHASFLEDAARAAPFARAAANPRA